SLSRFAWPATKGSCEPASACWSAASASVSPTAACCSSIDGRRVPGREVSGVRARACPDLAARGSELCGPTHPLAELVAQARGGGRRRRRGRRTRGRILTEHDRAVPRARRTRGDLRTSEQHEPGWTRAEGRH